MMTLGELVEELSVLQEDLEDLDPIVMVAYQPTYPLQTRVAEVKVVDGTVYVVCEQGADYAPKEVYG
jgi:hypothetical protein